MSTQEKKQSHTPGPWFTCAQATRPHSHALVGIGNGAVHIGYSSVTPAMGTGEAEANARLICAAPELLAALEELVEAIWNGDMEKNGAEYYTDDARKIISKAKGDAR